MKMLIKIMKWNLNNLMNKILKIRLKRKRWKKETMKIRQHLKQTKNKPLKIMKSRQ